MTTFTSTIRLTEPVVGGDTGLWGGEINSDLVYIDEAINQTVTVNIADTNISLVADGSSSDQARYKRYSFTGALTADRTVTLPANMKVGYATNATSGGKNVILSAGGTTLSLPPESAWTLFQVDGSNNVTTPSLRTGGLVSTGNVSVGSITGTGNISVGQNSFISFSSVNALTLNQSGASAASGLVINASNVIGNLCVWEFGGGGVGSITTNGSTTAYNTTSDYRLKVTFGKADTGALIDSVPVYDAAWKHAPDVRRPMMLAHEMPAWAVRGEKDGEEMQQADYMALIPALWAEVQSLRVRVRELESR